MEVELSALRERRSERSAANGARSRGGSAASWPGRSSAKPSIQLTDEISVITCQKVAATPTRKTSTMKIFRYGEAAKIDETVG